MSSRQTTQKVREFELTLEDAARLAECLNSFDDSDSWPGGFTHGNPFTAERVFKSWSKSKNIRVIVGYSEDKIVGHCNISNAELDAEATYIGLLGVNPQYQGQGYGKAMLIEAAQAAADAGKRRVDLHTWGGNLKAMPLYKRYNWVPGTRVLMESHIPGIIGAEMFTEFFERYDWYDSFKVEITQDMDDIVEDGFGIFRYYFEGDDGDVLSVKIDREAKGICGFNLTLDGKTISAEVRPTTHVGYIGLGETEINLKIRNETGSNLLYSINANPVRDIAVELTGELSGSLLANEEVHLSGTMSIKSEATPIDKETNAFEKAKTQGEFTLTLGDRGITLFSGLIPTEALTISTGPMYPCISPGEETTIGIGLQNNTNEVVRGEIMFGFPPQTNLKESTIDFQIEPGKAYELPLKLTTTYSDDNSVLPIQVNISVNQESALVPLMEKTLNIPALVPLMEKTLNIPVIGASGAVVYEGLSKHFILETESIRIGLQKTPSMALTYLEYKPLNERFTGWGLLPDVGYPE